MIEWLCMEENIKPDTSKKETKAPTATSIFFKATLLSLVFVVIMLLITALGVLGYGYHKLNQFTHKAGTSVGELKTLIESGINKQPENTNGYKTILLLGLDTVVNKPDSPQLTDTMLLISINTKTAEINTLSLPRDLWSNDYKTRINALYEYGKERYPDRPEQFPEEVVEALTGIDINHTITMSLENVAEIIDVLGGIEVNVEEGFTDTEFPREDIDLQTAKTHDELYETVTFEKGLQYMDGKTTLKYIRSRKSSNLDQGTDVARSNRQQQIVSALVSKILSFDVVKNTDTLATLYLLYDKEFENQFSKLEMISTLNSLYPQKDNIEVNSHTLSIYPDNENGVITNPPLYKYSGQWVYEVRNLENLQNEVKKYLQN